MRPRDVTPTLWTIFAALLAAGFASAALERRGRLGSPPMEVHGDVKRETHFLSQYGQFTCLLVACAMVLSLDGLDQWRRALALFAASVITLLSTHAAKRIFGRIRPGRERDGYPAGAFLGPTWRRLSWRESFPSSHAAGAFAMSAVLAHYYPEGAPVWWSLAAVTSALRWLLDAHWLSDVLVGGAVGILCGVAAVWTVGAIG